MPLVYTWWKLRVLEQRKLRMVENVSFFNIVAQTEYKTRFSNIDTPENLIQR